MIEQVLAGGVLAVCAALLIRMGLGDRRRAAVDAAARRACDALRHSVRRLAGWRARRREAARAAREAIRRASDGQWDGNVYKPKSFRPPRRPH